MQTFDAMSIGYGWPATSITTWRVPWSRLFARSVRSGFDDAPMNAIRLWSAAGAGMSSQPVIVPITVARPSAGDEMARNAIVALPPSTPIQVLGAWPEADTVNVTGFVSSAQPAPPDAPPSGVAVAALESNRASPVESVSAMHGASSSAAPTRTDALDNTLPVSSSMTYTFSLPPIGPSPMPPPGIRRGSLETGSGELLPHAPATSANNPAKDRVFCVHGGRALSG